ncbi:hypothetical protein [Pontibacillus sp. HMF3514]|uniref:hypothetical protein n=1 Tax=Pontibacillus sp. HMF3514 TaxID=2692425 RepID=UPI00131FD05E|nr:hypothetical protein [Pontibacillus sp. HMF3514]QHE52844.1 hypothetical protein GS400_12790 [Pontibacillus sp. HMF3514]
MSKEYNYKVEWCPICEQGWVEIMKDQESNKLILICSECENEWENPEYIIVSSEKVHLSENISTPTFKEVKEKGWQKYIIS